MPYTIIKRNGKFRLVNSNTGKLEPTVHETRESADSHRRAIMAGTHGKEPKK